MYRARKYKGLSLWEYKRRISSRNGRKVFKKIQFIKEREEYLKTKEPCSKCKEYNSCKGGCIAATYNYYGNTGYADPTCIQHA